MEAVRERREKEKSGRREQQGDKMEKKGKREIRRVERSSKVQLRIKR